jgi:hypothetical protein
MGNGEWGMGNGEWGIGNWEFRGKMITSTFEYKAPSLELNTLGLRNETQAYWLRTYYSQYPISNSQFSIP